MRKKLKLKVSAAEIRDVMQGPHPVIGSATADSIAVVQEGMKGKGHNKGGNPMKKAGRKPVIHVAKYVAEGVALAQKIETASESKRDWVLGKLKYTSVALRDVAKGVQDFYEARIKSIKMDNSQEGDLTVGGKASAKSAEVRRSEIVAVLGAMRRASTMMEDGNEEAGAEVREQLSKAPGWNALYALSVQIKREAENKPLTASAVKAAVDQVFRDRNATPFSEKQADKWLDQARRFKAAPPPQLFRFLQTVIAVAVQTPGLAKYADVKKLAESVKLSKLLTKHAKAEITQLDVARAAKLRDPTGKSNFAPRVEGYQHKAA